MMARLMTIPLLLCLMAGPIYAQETKDGAAKQDAKQTSAQEKSKEAQPAADSLAAEIQKNPNDVALLRKYVGQELIDIATTMRTDPDQAEKVLQELQKTLDNLKPTEDDAKTLLQQAHRAAESYGEQVALARISLDDLQKKLEENPDGKTFRQYLSKVVSEIGPLARTEPEQAEKKLQAAKEFINKLQEQSDDEKVDTLAKNATRSFVGLEQRIASAKRLMELVGKDAAPMEVEAWVNGAPLSSDDLRGKVVLLDFWAVWCGPCIATFPHLREWQEKYADQGLVIIGLTRYYKYQWDEDAGRATRGQDVSPEQEQQMLEKFAEQHKLEHRFAIQKGNDLSNFYGVTGIPHVVVIDRQGKVRLIRVGSGEKNAQDIENMIKKLIGSET